MATESNQSPPPSYDGGSQSGHETSEHPTHHHQELEDAIESIYGQLGIVRGLMEELLEEAKEAKLRKKLETVPVRTSDLLRGFQSAVARANNAVAAGEYGEEDIGDMAVKDLEVTLHAPVIDGGHADDPVLMLPNIKSVDETSASVTLKFSVVNLPAGGGG